MKILIANRGEIAVRIIRAAAELDIPTLAVYAEDDAESLHIRMADQCQLLAGRGISAYLDIDQLMEAAKAHKCTAIHPGYGFLSENPSFARRCKDEGILFIGPGSETIKMFGDKAKARSLAETCGLPLLPGTMKPTSLQEAASFLADLGEGGAIMVKALNGGGGRGMRAVHDISDLDETYRICQSEAFAAFGNGDLYVECLVTRARHVEVQIIGDGTGNVSHVWERECSLQRRNQKVMEIAPSPGLSESLRNSLTEAAVRLAKSVRYKGLGTIEFLVDASPDKNKDNDASAFYFLEVNPRLQVEHTVTEEVTGIDLVKTQIEIARGRSLESLGLLQENIPKPFGFAMQTRINMEKIGPMGEIIPSSGLLSVFDPPTGPGIRVDTFGYPGYATSLGYDSLLAKLISISRTPVYTDVVKKAYRALCEFRIEGVDTNIPFLQNLLVHPMVQKNDVTTGFIETHLELLVDSAKHVHKPFYFECSNGDAPNPSCQPDLTSNIERPENTMALESVIPGTVVELEVKVGDFVNENKPVIIIEAMKMQHFVHVGTSGIVRLVCVKKGDTISKGQPLLFIEPAVGDDIESNPEKERSLDEIRPELAEVMSRHRSLLDEMRQEAVKRRRESGQRTARENILDLVDQETFIEYGGLALAAQRQRRSVEELIRISPADGLITGIGSVNGNLFDGPKARCAVMSYDYTVMAGTQGAFNHHKTDRMLQLAEDQRLPVVLFAEGGGGRPGDVDALAMKVAALDLETFTRYGRLSGLVPLVGIASGRCFAGNAALLGLNDVIIATKNSNIGMGGPAMIEGGGLGKYRPEEIGPIEVQSPNGVVDIVVEDEAEAVSMAKKYLSYFQGTLSDWTCADQRLLRHVVPENRLRVYDVRKVIDILADEDSVLELRKEFGVGIITALVRIEGIPFGLTANNSMHLGGAIDADAADKTARFMQLCDAFDLPLITLSDTPGFMVGPEAEKTAQVRRFARMFVNAAGATIPIFSVILRKGYGLGAMAMVGGGYHRPVFNVSWPTGEFGSMGLEGAVRLGFKKELEAVEDPKKQKALFDSFLQIAYEHGKAINMASFLEIDNVIDPLETRHWIVRGIRSCPLPEKRSTKKRPNIDTW